jgi:hypothetical protein
MHQLDLLALLALLACLIDGLLACLLGFLAST